VAGRRLGAAHCHPGGHFATRLQVAGRHNVRNALAATACALAAGCTLAAVAEGLAAFVPVAGRSRVLALPMPGRTLTVVDDCYNANPDSMQAAIAVLAELPAPRWLVLGDMGEVGSQGPQFHAEAGALARASGIEHLLALGTLSTHAVQAFAQASGPTPLPRRGILTTKPPCWRRCAQPCPAWAVCW